MDIETQLALVKENTVEVIHEEELRTVLQKKGKPIAYCGYEPSGPVHLGHLVTIQKLKQLETVGFHIKILLADWHAFLNRKGDWETIHSNAEEWKKTIQSLGLRNAEFVLGTEFQHSREYLDDVMELAQRVTLKRALRAMQEVARDSENAHVSQMVYPLMQIADIKHLGVDLAQSGIEQRKIHMLGREVLGHLNYPNPVLVHTPLINGLQGREGKMSSSVEGSVITVKDSEEEIQRKIGKAFAEPGKTEHNAVLDIVQLIVMPHFKQLEISRPEKFGGDVTYTSFDELRQAYVNGSVHPQDLKNSVGKALAAHLRGM